MAYTKTQWVNDSEPPISAENLNKMEQGIFDAQPQEPMDYSDYEALTPAEKNDGKMRLVKDYPGGTINASNVGFDNTGTSLPNNVQGAISSINSNLTTSPITLTAVSGTEIIYQNCFRISNVVIINVLITTSKDFGNSEQIINLPYRVSSLTDTFAMQRALTSPTNPTLKWVRAQNNSVIANGNTIDSGNYVVVNFAYSTTD